MENKELIDKIFKELNYIPAITNSVYNKYDYDDIIEIMQETIKQTRKDERNNLKNTGVSRTKVRFVPKIKKLDEKGFDDLFEGFINERMAQARKDERKKFLKLFDDIFGSYEFIAKDCPFCNRMDNGLSEFRKKLNKK